MYEKCEKSDAVQSNIMNIKGEILPNYSRWNRGQIVPAKPQN
jgi:hypothetical protein